MNFVIRKKALALLLTLSLLMLASQTVLAAQGELPNPVAFLMGLEYYEQDGKQWTRYKLAVENYTAYPNELFAPAPDLPPCGQNKSAARTWVEILDQSGKRLYGFCAMQSNNDLTKLWFAMETGIVPPSYVYLVLNDRKTGKTYKSNLVDTTS